MLTYLSLACHLRYQKDEGHLLLKKKLKEWRARETRIVRCRKCGDLFEVEGIKKAHHKRCPKCQSARANMSKREYERYSPKKEEDPRSTARKVFWDGLPSRRLLWTPGDQVYHQVVTGWKDGKNVKTIMAEVGVSFPIFRAICEHALGEEYFERIKRGRAERGKKFGEALHASWVAMSPEERSEFIRKRFKNSSALETTFASQLLKAGLSYRQNVWKTVMVGGLKVPREADFIVESHGSKVVVLCDGTAFHGPNAHFGSPSKVADDNETANGFVGLGYSVARYSEDEIHRSEAILDLRRLIAMVPENGRFLRNWITGTEQWFPE